MDRLRVTGHRWNHKQVWRVYCPLRLNLPRRTKRRVPARVVQPLDGIPQPNGVWAVGFISNTLYGRRRFRTLNLLDEVGREVLAIEGDMSLPAERVVRVLEQVVAWRGQPQAIRLDNGPGFFAARRIALRYIQPGKPNQNAFVERFNRTFRTRCAMPTRSSRGIRCASLVRSGCGSTTRSGPMTPWPPGLARDVLGQRHTAEVLPWKCFLDRDAYAFVRDRRSRHLTPVSSCRRFPGRRKNHHGCEGRNRTFYCTQ